MDLLEGNIDNIHFVDDLTLLPFKLRVCCLCR